MGEDKEEEEKIERGIIKRKGGREEECPDLNLTLEFMPIEP